MASLFGFVRKPGCLCCSLVGFITGSTPTRARLRVSPFRSTPRRQLGSKPSHRRSGRSLPAWLEARVRLNTTRRPDAFPLQLAEEETSHVDYSRIPQIS